MAAPLTPDTKSVALDSEDFISQMTTEKLRLAKAEMEDYLDEFEREFAISYIAGNFSANTHLCVVILRGKSDDEIRDIINEIIVLIDAEIALRRKK